MNYNCKFSAFNKYLFPKNSTIPISGKDESISASLHIKPKDPKAFQTPAPCDYTPEKNDVTTMAATPKFSFGVKVDHSKPNGTPGKTFNLIANCKKNSYF